MSWSSAGLMLSLVVMAAPVAAEEFSVIVGRGSTIVRVTGSDDGEFREETLREDPTPRPLVAEEPKLTVVEETPPSVEEEERRPARESVIVVRDRHTRQHHVRPKRHGPHRSERRLDREKTVDLSAPSVDADKSRWRPIRVRSKSRADSGLRPKAHRSHGP